MAATSTSFAIVDYPGSLQSAVYDFEELLSISSRLCVLNQFDREFDVEILSLEQIEQIEQRPVATKDYAVIFLPPSLDSIFYLDPGPALLAWLVEQHGAGSKLCSACAGNAALPWERPVRNRGSRTACRIWL